MPACLAEWLFGEVCKVHAYALLSVMSRFTKILKTLNAKAGWAGYSMVRLLDRHVQGVDLLGCMSIHYRVAGHHDPVGHATSSVACCTAWLSLSFWNGGCYMPTSECSMPQSLLGSFLITMSSGVM
jgi:hypothetical protein